MFPFETLVGGGPGEDGGVNPSVKIHLTLAVAVAIGVVTNMVSSLIMNKLEWMLVVDPVKMERIKLPSVKTHLALTVAIAEASCWGSDRHGLIVDHVQVGMDAEKIIEKD